MPLFLISFPSPGNQTEPQHGYKLSLMFSRFETPFLKNFFHLRLSVIPGTAQKSPVKHGVSREDSILAREGQVLGAVKLQEKQREASPHGIPSPLSTHSFVQQTFMKHWLLSGANMVLGARTIMYSKTWLPSWRRY